MSEQQDIGLIPSSFDPAKLTVLVAEAEENLRRSLVDLLAELGFKKVLEARNGTRAWSHLKQGVGDLVIAGWDMPEMNGMALLKVMRADPKYFAVPVVLVTGHVTKSQVIEAGEAGVTDILLLPLTHNTLCAKIEAIYQAKLDPRFRRAEQFFQHGLELMRQERWEDAVGEFQKVLSLHENAEVYYNLGYIKTAQSSYEEALSYFRRAIQINNDFARAYQKMGECYVQLGRQHLAEQSFQKAAAIYMDKEMDDSAEVVLKAVLKLNPETINVYNSLGIIYRRQGRYQKAIDQYQKALKVNSQDENIYYNMGRIFFETGEMEKAERVLCKSLQVNPTFAEAKDLLAAARRRLESNGH